MTVKSTRAAGALTLPVLRGRARTVGLLGGCVVAALGIAAALQSRLGVGPYDVLIEGAAESMGVTFGTAGVAIGVLVVAGGWWLGGPVGVGTVATVALVGPFVDAWRLVVPQPETLGWQVVMLAVAVPVIAVGLSLIVGARLGVGPVEVVMLALVRRGGPLRWVRTGLEVTIALTGWALGGVVGVGTVVIALTLGHALAALVPPETT